MQFLKWTNKLKKDQTASTTVMELGGFSVCLFKIETQ